MASCYESIPLSVANKLLSVCAGLPLADTWASPVEPCIFLELGRLTKSPDGHASNGQICCMIQSDWRVERQRSIQFGSGFRDCHIERGRASLVGAVIESVGIGGSIPELAIRLHDGRRFTTFTTWQSQPHWSIAFNDRSLFPLHPLWKGIDVSPWIGVSKGRTEIEYCYDDSKASVRQAVMRMGFTARRGWRCPHATIS